MVASHYADGHDTLGAFMLGWGRRDTLAEERTGILLVPGGGGTETSWQNTSAFNTNVVTGLMARLCDIHGYRFLTLPSDWTWGNDTIIERISDARGEAISRLNISERVHLLGISMGGCCSLEWARRNPGLVAGLAMLIPIVDQQDIYDNDRVDPYGTITPPEDAFAGSRPPDTHVPARNATAYRGIPPAIWYSNNDSVCVPEVTEPFGERAGAQMHNLGDQFPSGFAIPGHAADNLAFDEVAAYFREHDN